MLDVPKGVYDANPRIWRETMWPTRNDATMITKLLLRKQSRCQGAQVRSSHFFLICVDPFGLSRRSLLLVSILANTVYRFEG